MLAGLTETEQSDAFRILQNVIHSLATGTTVHRSFSGASLLAPG